MDDRSFSTPRFLNLGDVRLSYHTEGDGPPLVFLHGFPLSGSTWRGLIPTLAPHFTCYAFDLVGFGRTTSPHPEDFTSAGQARVIQRGLDALGVTSFALMGNDSGGWISRDLALLDVARVTRLVLTNTEIPHHRPPWIPLYQATAGWPGAVALFGQLIRSRWFRHSGMAFGGCFADPSLVDGAFHDLFVAPLLADRARLASALLFLEQMDFRRVDAFASLHRQLTMPTAFFWASADPTFPEPLAREMATQLPRVEVFESLNGCKLFLQEEVPERLAEKVRSFLWGTPGR